VSEEEAKGIIVRGFLDLSILGLPTELEQVINDWMDKITESGL
jgi:hypothetical protein